jgi:hypothetical protein
MQFKVNSKYLVTLDRPSDMYTDGKVDYDTWGDTIGVPPKKVINHELAIITDIRAKMNNRYTDCLFYFPNLDITQALSIYHDGGVLERVGWEAIPYCSLKYNKIWNQLNA